MENLRLPTMDFETDLIESIDVIRENAPKDGQPYYGLFSGGKDSIVIKHLAELAGVKVEWHYNVTTIDPPELVYFIRNKHLDVIWERPRHGNFFRRAARKKYFPTRSARWCCSEYKESVSPPNRTILMGIRAQESSKRSKRWGLVSEHFRRKSKVINPIYHWEASDLWNWIRSEGLSYCQLYDEGFKRLGCIGCPMARKAGKLQEFARWPKYEKKWRSLLEYVWNERTGTRQRDGRPWWGDVYFDHWEEMWSWWLNDEKFPSIEAKPHSQMTLHPVNCL